ncbi:MAG: SMP-30/gluconolactonase/LRE family protein, partial [Pseudomonadota bacterium]|nr:SMP-30/gluconolactonase/LRE family protein [Pseudomonadota bacterium]
MSIIVDGFTFLVAPRWRDGRTLIIGESFAAQLTAFDRKEDGSLSNRRIWASVPGRAPDGCCLDAQGAIWMASPVSNDFIRILE